MSRAHGHSTSITLDLHMSTISQTHALNIASVIDDMTKL